MPLEETRRNSRTYKQLRELCGHVQDGSAQTVKVSQDDATRTWHVTVGDRNPRTYHGDSLPEAIHNAAEKELK